MEDTLGLRIRLARTQQRLTQRALAARVGLSPTALCQIEQDHAEPTVTHLCAIARVLRVSLDVLCGHEVEHSSCTGSMAESQKHDWSYNCSSKRSVIPGQGQ